MKGEAHQSVHLGFQEGFLSDAVLLMCDRLHPDLFDCISPSETVKRLEVLASYFRSIRSGAHDVPDWWERWFVIEHPQGAMNLCPRCRSGKWLITYRHTGTPRHNVG